MNRRQFLKALSLIGITGLSTGSFTGCATRFGPSQQITVNGWLGDDPDAGHRIRDGRLPTPLIPKPDQTMDVVIVGAGISGLTAAFHLRHTDRLMVLESAPTVGGNAKSAHYAGVEYALGSAYFVDTDEPFASLYQAIGLPLTPLRQPEDWLADAPGQLAPLESGRFSQGFQALQQHIMSLSRHPDFPRFPVEQATTAGLALDRMTLADYLHNLDLPQPVLHWVDAYCRSSLGCGIATTSAYVGLNFLSELSLPVYALPGGNAGIVKRLARHIGTERLRTQAMTYRVQVDQHNHITVAYWHQGHPRAVRAKTVILALPFHVAARVLSHSPAGLATLPYASYVVANLGFQQRVLDSGYDTWMPQCTQFTDVVDATYCLETQPTTAQVLTLYAPQTDRQTLLSANPTTVGQTLWQAAHQWLPHLPVPDHISLTRYGHQLLSSRSGIIHHVRGLPQQWDQVIFAHSDGQGASSVEAAILQGLNAAKLAMPLLKR